MHRSTGSQPPQDGKSSRSPSPSQDGGRKKASTSVPTNALVAIRAFFGGKMGVLMLLQFLVGTETSFNWNAYQGSTTPLPEGQLTAEVVAKWLLTLMLRKPAPGEAVVTDDVWHHVLQFLRANANLVELKPLFDFIKKYQKELALRKIIPNWVLVVLAPICESDELSLSVLISQDFAPRPDFWQNAIRGLTPALLPFWFTEQTCYIWQHLLFQLLQQPLSEEVKQIVKAFFAGKPFEFFMDIPVDLFIFLKHSELLAENDIRRFLFTPKRRNLWGLNFFLYDTSIDNPLVQEFLKKNFPTILTYISRTHPNSFQIEFSKVFRFTHVFFKTLLGTEGLLVKSNIRGQEMAKFLHLFCWDPSIFFPRSIDVFVSEIMRLPDHWKFLFVQLCRCEPRRFGEYHVSELIKCVRRLEMCLFSKTLASMMRVYMTEVVAYADPEVRKIFFRWLLEEKQSVRVHFPLTPDSIQFCLREFPSVQTKKTLFWWLFTVHSAEIDKRSDRELTIDMTKVCNETGFQVTEEELQLRAPNGMSSTGFVSQFFNVITLNFEFGSYKVTQNFYGIYDRDKFQTEEADLFRSFVSRWQSSLDPHINPKGVPNCSALLCLIITCEARPKFFEESPQEDRAFMIKLFEVYLPKLSLSEELVKLLYRLSKLMPDEVKQAMFQNCAHIKILHEETLECTSGRKRSRDPTDPLSYEAKCSRCAHYFPLQGLGLDGHGGAICRRCSQANGTPISTTLGRLTFGSL
jgi:hypothetical protein